MVTLAVLLAAATVLSGTAWGPHASGATLRPTGSAPASGSASTGLPAPFFSTGQNASIVLGKANFTASPAVANSSTLCDSNNVAFDGGGDLWVADYCNHRVLEFTPPFSSSMAAHLVLGQTNFTGNAARSGAGGMSEPSALAFDASGDLWVADTFNNRVLEFRPPFTTGMAASLVVGQADFNGSTSGNGSGQLAGPVGLAFSTSGALWVSEFLNNRLTEFIPPFLTGMAATVVLGQAGFGFSGAASGPGHLRGPFGIAFNVTGALWVGDANNNRVLAYLPPFTTGENAAFVLGQPNFSASDPGVGPARFYGPNYLSFDASGNLWVGDTNNNRVLEFHPPIASTSSAAVVLGQPNATSRMARTSAVGMSNPAEALMGPDGSLYVAEFSNSRVDRFTFPLTNGSAAELVIGQAGFDTSTTAPTAGNLGRAAASAFDAAGDLWVLDTYDNRVLEFAPPFTLGESAAVVLGQGNLNDSLNGQTASNLYLPSALAFAPDGSLWVADTFNNRVLGFRPPFTNGMAANVVLGQPNFTATDSPIGPRSLAFPEGVAFDPSGNLWVSDTLRSRVLEFASPFVNFEPATQVIGQSDFTSFLPGTSPTALFFPTSLAFDTKATLYVADTDNNRVLAFGTPLATDEAARGVLGQTNFYSGGPGTGPGALDHPGGLAVDPRGALWVADGGNNRVLRYSLPVIDGAPGDLALGQPNLIANGASATSGTLRAPAGVSVDPVGGGVWVADCGNSRLLYFPGNALSVATGTVTFAAGRGAIDQHAITGVQLNFSSVSGASSAVVVTQRLGAPPPGLTPTGFTNTTYFALTVSVPQGAFGAVQACFTTGAMQVYAQMEYWGGTVWAIAGSVTANKYTVCGTLPMASLPGTPVGVSVPGPSTLPAFPTLYLFGYATIAFIVVAGILVAINVRRQRRLAEKAPPQPSGPAAAPPLPDERPRPKDRGPL